MASPTARPTMPSADFCTGVRVPRGPLSPVSETRCRPPEVSSIAFTAHPPDLQPQALDGYGLRGQSSARPTWAASYPVSVRQVAALLHASFRPRLAATPLRFANTSPPSGCVGDLHPLAVEHARHTTHKSLRKLSAALRKRRLPAGHGTVARLLQERQFSLRTNRKRLARTNDPQRDRQFRYLARVRRWYLTRGLPVISVDITSARKILT